MAEPVKTTLLKAIQIAVEGATGVAQVIRNPMKPIDLETGQFPLVFMFDDSESLQENNRVVLATMPVWIEIWLKEHENTIGDTADEMAANIYVALYSLKPPTLGSILVRPDMGSPNEKFYVDEFSGGIVLHYLAQFRFKSGDPTDPVKA